MLTESAWLMDEDKEKKEDALPATSSARAAVAPSLLTHVVVTSRASPKQLISLPNSMSKAVTVVLSSSSTKNSSGQKRSRQQLPEFAASIAPLPLQQNVSTAESTMLNGYEILPSGFVDEVR